MTTLITITNRIAFRKGDYIDEVSDNKVVMKFDKRSIAINTHKAMLKQNATGKITFDGDKTITRIINNMKEKEIVKTICEELDYVIKNKTPMQKIKYEIYEIIERR